MNEIGKTKSLADSPIGFKIHMKGNYMCSCGCGNILGLEKVKKGQSDVCCGVGLDTHEGVINMRVFTPNCWNKLRKYKSIKDLYREYAEPEPVIESL